MLDKKSKLNSLIEKHTIDYIPETERYGKLFSQFSLWFGANLQITAIVTGALAIVLGGDIFWSIIGLLIGQLLGGSVMALHGAQGPKLGVPQMVISRAPFGIYGAMLPIIFVCIMYIGFSASGTVLAGQAIAQLCYVSDETGILLFGLCLIGFTFCGYKIIHRIGKIASIIGIIAFFYMFYILITKYAILDLLAIRQFSWIHFTLAIALSTSWQIAFGPYAADYSRYLPNKTPTFKVFLAIGGGSVIGTQIAMVFGVLAAGLAQMNGEIFRSNEVAYIVKLSGVGLTASILYFCIALGKVVITTLNAYGSFMSITTIISGLQKKSTLSQRSRFVYIFMIVGLSIIIALLGRGDFLHNFSTFLLFLLTFFTPWSAINLVDYYIIKKQHYNIDALFDINGCYGKWNKIGILIYIFGIVIQLPFIHTPFYTGILVHHINNIDISWFIGWSIPAIFYYFFAHQQNR